MTKSVAILVIVVLIVGGTAAASSTGMQKGATPVYRGIDVSHHQGTINWNTVSSQIDFAILRCGYGDNITSQDDTQWARNASECERLGIPYGVYLYSYALSDAQAQSEAEHAIRLLSGHSPDLPVYLDLEDKSIANNCSNADILRHATIFCERIESAGYSVGIYANKDWWTNRLTSATYDRWSRWIAIWDVSSPSYSKPYDAWQYSDSGSVAGIGSGVDMDYWYGSFPSQHQHSYSSMVTLAPGCESAGIRTYSCSCGDSYTESIAALGHSWGEWTTTTAPTCIVEGVSTRTCSRCGQLQTQSVPLGEHHYFLETHPATCIENGYDLHTCTVCGDKYEDHVIPASGHSFTGGICTVCGTIDESVKKGDINLDGIVSSADAVLLAKYLIGTVQLNAAQRSAADINGDNAVTSADAVRLSQLLLQ